MSTLRLGGRDVPAVVVGSVVTIQNAGLYDLYFIFPMEQEVATMDLIGNAFLVAGVILTLLVGAVAWVVALALGIVPVARYAVVSNGASLFAESSTR